MERMPVETLEVTGLDGTQHEVEGITEFTTRVDKLEVRLARTPGCQLGYTDHTAAVIARCLTAK